MINPNLFTELRKQILFNFSRGQWAASLANSEEIIHSPVNFPHLDKFEWFEIVRSNFGILREFFENLTKPKSIVSNIDEILSAPSSMFSARLGVDVTPLLKLWKTSLLLACPECKIKQYKCPCLISETDCVSVNTERHTKSCAHCNEEMVVAHLLELNFFDVQNRNVKVEFTPELMDCFLSEFSARSILSKVVFCDFIQTIKWHAERSAIGRPFIQNIVLKKIQSHGADRFVYISGLLQPIANGDK